MTDDPLPETRLLPPVIKPLGPLPLRERRRVAHVDQWPLVPDDTASLRVALAPGVIVTVRTRWGRTRQLRVRTINQSVSKRRFMVGDTRDGLCRSVWLSDVISTGDPIKPRALR